MCAYDIYMYAYIHDTACKDRRLFVVVYKCTVSFLQCISFVANSLCRISRVRPATLRAHIACPD